MKKGRPINTISCGWGSFDCHIIFDPEILVFQSSMLRMFKNELSYANIKSNFKRTQTHDLRFSSNRNQNWAMQAINCHDFGTSTIGL